LVGRENFVRRLPGEHGDRALQGVEGVHEGEAEVFFFGEDAGAFARTVADLGGIGAEERRGDGDVVGVENGEIERNMMALEAPAPRGLGGRFAEDRHIIEGGIAADGVFFDFAEDVFEGDDRLGAGGTALAEAGAEEG
jgi:hypothetical protein